MEELRDQSSEEEGPENISHLESKSAAHERQKLEKEVAKKQKDARKDARRKRQKMMIEQKEHKKFRTLDRLPETVIDILSSVDQEKDLMKEKVSDRTEVDDLTLYKDDKQNPTTSKNKGPGKEKSKRKSNRRKSDKKGKKVTGLPRVCVLNEKYKPIASKAEKGRKFLREQLYGSRIKRVDSTSARNARAIGSARPKMNF